MFLPPVQCGMFPAAAVWVSLCPFVLVVWALSSTSPGLFPARGFGTHSLTQRLSLIFHTYGW